MTTARLSTPELDARSHAPSYCQDNGIPVPREFVTRKRQFEQNEAESDQVIELEVLD
jgi:hypothetical protein